MPTRPGVAQVMPTKIVDANFHQGATPSLGIALTYRVVLWKMTGAGPIAPEVPHRDMPGAIPSPQNQPGEIAPQWARGADFGPVMGWVGGVTPGGFRSSAGVKLTKGLFDTHQETIVPRCRVYKSLKAMELVGPPGLEPGTKGLRVPVPSRQLSRKPKNMVGISERGAES